MRLGLGSSSPNVTSTASRTFRINSSRVSPSVKISRLPSGQCARALNPPSVSSSLTMKVISLIPPPRSSTQYFNLAAVILRIDLLRHFLRHLTCPAEDLELHLLILAVPD